MENNNVKELLGAVNDLEEKFNDFTEVLKNFAENYNANTDAKPTMKLEDLIVKRTIEMKTSEYQEGDIISFELTDGEKVEAIAVKEESDGMVFILSDCLKDEYEMFEDVDCIDRDKICYEESDLRKKLNGKILDRFPDYIKSKLKPMQIGNTDKFDLLRIPTEKEIFGKNEYGKDEGNVEQFEIMKLRKNRIASEGLNGTYQWYWLQNKVESSASLFARVDGSGASSCRGASRSGGVRPLFKI